MLRSENEIAVYENLYRIAEANYDSHYGKFQYSISAFLVSVNLEPNRIDLSILERIPEEDFLESCYLAILNRWPDDLAVVTWREKQKLLSEDDYKEQLLATLLTSRERIIKGIITYNNCFSAEKPQRLSVAESVMKPGVAKIYRMYKMLPRWLRLIIRTLLKVR